MAGDERDGSEGDDGTHGPQNFDDDEIFASFGRIRAAGRRQVADEADAVKRLEAFNVAKEIAEIKKQKNRSRDAISETVPTVFPTLVENQTDSASENLTIN